MLKLPESPFRARQIFGPRQLPTPFGTVSTPVIELPPLKLPRIDDNFRRALGHTIGMDLTAVLGLIPWAGTLIADTVSAMHSEQVKKILPKQELEDFSKWDKTYPNTFALIRSRL